MPPCCQETRRTSPERANFFKWESSFVALDPAAEAEVSRLWSGMLPTVLGNLKTLIERR